MEGRGIRLAFRGGARLPLIGGARIAVDAGAFGGTGDAKDFDEGFEASEEKHSGKNNPGYHQQHGLEDILILHDLNGTAGWDAMKAHRYPAKTFRSGDTILTVVLANKLPLEQQLGVDLIYVNECQ
jgi:hypothetical protein